MLPKVIIGVSSDCCLVFCQSAAGIGRPEFMITRDYSIIQYYAGLSVVCCSPSLVSDSTQYELNGA